MIKKEKREVTVTIADYFDFKFEFDTDSKTEKICNEINNFWGGNIERLENADNCIYNCVGRMIANEIIRLQLKSSFYCGENNAIIAFNDGIEGFYPIDGSYGIKLTYCDDFELNDLDVEFKQEVKEVRNEIK